MPYLDVVASRSSDGNQIYIKAVNTDLANALSTTIEIKGANIRPLANLDTLTADSLEASNSFTTPDAIAIHKSDIQVGSHFTVELPKHSVSVITLQTN